VHAGPLSQSNSNTDVDVGGVWIDEGRRRIGQHCGTPRCRTPTCIGWADRLAPRSWLRPLCLSLDGLSHLPAEVHPLPTRRTAPTRRRGALRARRKLRGRSRSDQTARELGLAAGDDRVSQHCRFGLPGILDASAWRRRNGGLRVLLRHLRLVPVRFGSAACGHAGIVCADDWRHGAGGGHRDPLRPACCGIDHRESRLVRACRILRRGRARPDCRHPDHVLHAKVSSGLAVLRPRWRRCRSGGSRR
jgi:hypothetical protein